ncbi:MAG: hypothetical protein JWO80_3235 [Bryobacterales bacterium]|nr:hypothetical protein [Bryobacterales bacterium]
MLRDHRKKIDRHVTVTGDPEPEEWSQACSRQFRPDVLVDLFLLPSHTGIQTIDGYEPLFFGTCDSDHIRLGKECN